MFNYLYIVPHSFLISHNRESTIDRLACDFIFSTDKAEILQHEIVLVLPASIWLSLNINFLFTIVFVIKFALIEFVGWPTYLVIFWEVERRVNFFDRLDSNFLWHYLVKVSWLSSFTRLTPCFLLLWNINKVTFGVRKALNCVFFFLNAIWEFAFLNFTRFGYGINQFIKFDKNHLLWLISTHALCNSSSISFKSFPKFE
jgi:hypothetical protein